MTNLPTTITVLGSGAGALASATEFSQAGMDVTVADFERFRTNIDAIAERGTIQLRTPWQGITETPAKGSLDPAEAIRSTQVIVVSVPAFGHDTFAQLLVENLSGGEQVIFAGEGGGSMALVAAMRREGHRLDTAIAELNSLPYGARVRAPGLITASRKVGGTIVAGLPAGNEAVKTACKIWKAVEPAESVLETILLNFNAIDHVPPILANLGAIEGRPGKFLLWGEGASPAVANFIDAIDSELIEIRRVLGFENLKGYEEYLVEQGFAPKNFDNLYETLRSSAFADSTFATGPDALESRYITEDVPYALTLMASIGAEVGVETPTINSMIHLASVATGTDYVNTGRTLDTFGLAGLGRTGLLEAMSTGWW